MRTKLASRAKVIAEIAARQHGVIALAQLVDAGLSRPAVKRWVAAGHLHRIHRGVYAVGHRRLTREGHFMAAVLAIGEGAVLSHESAAALWSISPTCPPFVHVTVPGHGGRAHRKGIVVHRSKTLTPADTTLHRGIPVTTYERSLRDLGYREPTRSDLERLFLRVCRRHRIPKPEANVEIGPHTVDFLWPADRLVVEVDSWAYHRSRASFDSDRARDRYLTLRGYIVLRYTDRELDAAGPTVAAFLHAHLRRRRRAA